MKAEPYPNTSLTGVLVGRVKCTEAKTPYMCRALSPRLADDGIAASVRVYGFSSKRELSS